MDLEAINMTARRTAFSLAVINPLYQQIFMIYTCWYYNRDSEARLEDAQWVTKGGIKLYLPPS